MEGLKDKKIEVVEKGWEAGRAAKDIILFFEGSTHGIWKFPG